MKLPVLGLVCIAVLINCVTDGRAQLIRPAAPATNSRLSAQLLGAGLQDVDRLLDEGDLETAATALARLQEGGAAESQLRIRWIRLYDLSGNHLAAIDACRQGLTGRSDNRRLRYSLIAALVAADSLETARREVAVQLGDGAFNFTDAAGLIDLWRERAHPEEGLALCDALREEQADPRLFARNRAQCLAVLGRYPEAAAEFLKVLEINSLDLAPVRRDLQQYVVGDAALEAFQQGLDGSADPDAAGARLLSMDVALGRGCAETAIGIFAERGWSDRDRTRLLQLGGILAAELGMYQDVGRARATGIWLLRVLGPQGITPGLPPRQRIPTLETLAGVCHTLLGGIVPLPQEDAPLSAAFLEGIRQALEQVRRELPGCEMFFLAQIRLADYQRSALGDPAAAVADLQRLLQDLDLPVAGLARARLALGKAHLAAADTAAARSVLTALATEARDPDTELEAEYLLGLLDIAQDQWESGQKRLADLAEKDPGANMANDALEAGLRVAELLLDPGLGGELRAAYGDCVLRELQDQPRERIGGLSRLIRIADAAGTPSADSAAEYARLELVLLEITAGRPAAAAAQCDTLITDHPDGRYPARAMWLKAGLQAAAGDDLGAGRTREILLVQYPDSPQAEMVRIDLEK